MTEIRREEHDPEISTYAFKITDDGLVEVIEKLKNEDGKVTDTHVSFDSENGRATCTFHVDSFCE